ncbi:MAG: hypothetical protein H0X33_05155 [Taibaiella sp.]|nr:hypothetical protein [Taibaiella sp.]
MLWRIITWAFIITFLYRLFVRFILPVFHVTRATSHKLREMQDQMNNMQQKMPQRPKPTKRKDDDYIEYEEVK